MRELVDVTSSIEEKASMCRNWQGRAEGAVVANVDKKRALCFLVLEREESKPGAWAFEHEKVFYCFMPNEKPPCAGEKSRVITRKLCSAATGKIEETARYYLCNVRKK